MYQLYSFGFVLFFICSFVFTYFKEDLLDSPRLYSALFTLCDHVLDYANPTFVRSSHYCYHCVSVSGCFTRW